MNNLFIKLSAALALLGVAAGTATAQQNIKSAYDKAVKDGKMEVVASCILTDSDYDGNEIHYRNYTLQTDKKAIYQQYANNITKAFFRDTPDAYNTLAKKAGQWSELTRVAYGKDLDKIVDFMAHKDRNYHMAFFRDKDNSMKRTVYAMVSYKQKGRYIINLFDIYSDDPKQRQNIREHDVTAVKIDGRTHVIRGNTTVSYENNSRYPQYEDMKDGDIYVTSRYGKLTRYNVKDKNLPKKIRNIYDRCLEFSRNMPQNGGSIVTTSDNGISTIMNEDGITTIGPDGTSTIMNADGITTIGPNGRKTTISGANGISTTIGPHGTIINRNSEGDATYKVDNNMFSNIIENSMQFMSAFGYIRTAFVNNVQKSNTNDGRIMLTALANKLLKMSTDYGKLLNQEERLICTSEMNDMQRDVADKYIKQLLGLAISKLNK